MPPRLNISRLIMLYPALLGVILILSSFENLNWFFHFSTIGTGILNFITACTLLRISRGQKISFGILHWLATGCFIYAVITCILNNSLHLYFIELVVFLSYLLILLALGIEEIKKETQRISLPFLSSLSGLLILFFSVKILLTNETFAGRISGGLSNFGVFSMTLSIVSLPLYHYLRLSISGLFAAAAIFACIWVAVYNQTAIAILIHMAGIIQVVTKKVQVRVRTVFLFFAAAFFLLVIGFRETDSIKGRLNIWTTIVSQPESVPIHGTGFNKFKVQFAEMQIEAIGNNLITDYNYDDPSYAFNEFLQLYVEMGAFGLILLIIFILLLIITFLQCRKNGRSLFTTIILLAFSFPFHQPELFIAFSLPVFHQISFLHPMKYTNIFNNKLFFRLITVISAVGLLFYIILITDIIEWKNNSSEKAIVGKEIALILIEHPVQLKNFIQSKLLGSSQFGTTDQVIENILNLEKYTLNSDLMTLKGEYYYRSHDYNRAISSFSDANRLVPYKILPKYYLAKLYRELNDHQKADSLKQNILSAKPKIINTFYLRIIEQTRNL